MLTHFVQRHAKLVALIWIVLFALGGIGALQLNSTVKAGGFNDQNGETFVAQKLNEKVFGDPQNELTVVLQSDQAISSTTLDAAKSDIASLANISTVTDSRSLPPLASDSGHTQIMQIGINADNTTTQNMVPELRDAVAHAVRDTEVRSHVTGAAALDYDLNIQSQRDALKAEMIAFPLLIIVLLLIYRAVGPTIVTLVVAGVCLIGTQGVGTLLARSMDLSNMYITGASLIGLAVSVDYCLFLIARYKENLQPGISGSEALRQATGTAGHAIRFGGLSVIVALCALFIARNMVFDSIALAGITVTTIALLALATLVPAIITLSGNKLFFGKLPGYHTQQQHIDEHQSLTAKAALSAPLKVTLAIIIPLAAAALPLAAINLQVPVASSSILPEEMDSRAGIESIEKELDARQLFPTSITFTAPSEEETTDLAGTVVDFSSRLDSVPYIEKTIVAGQPGSDQIPTKLTASSDGQDYARILVFSTDLPDSDQAHEMIDSIAALTQNEPGIYVTGATAQGRDFDQLVSRSIPWIVTAVLLTSLLLLGWAFRSWRLPLIAVILNGIVVAAAMGLLSFLWKFVTGESINSVTPIVIFAIVFGLSMDYMVLMASRMKEIFDKGASHHQAIAGGVAKTSRLVVSAAIIMIGVFLSFMVAEISIVRELGLGLALAVALDALIVRPLLLPAVLLIIGPKVWGKARVSFPNTLKPAASTMPTPPENSNSSSSRDDRNHYALHNERSL